MDGEAIDEAMQDEDEAIDRQDDVLGCHVAAAVGAAGSQQDDHLDELRQREVHAGGRRPLGRHDGQKKRPDCVRNVPII